MLMFYLQLFETEEEKQLFTYLYTTHKQQMRYVANDILHDWNLAEDAVHNAFMGIANNMASIQGRSKEDVKNYVLKATKHTALNMRKKETRQKELLPELDAEPIEDSVLEDLCAKEGFEETVNAISHLKDPYGMVLYCHFVMQMDYAAIAVVLRKKPATIRQQVCRGKQMLCSLLREGSNHDE